MHRGARLERGAAGRTEKTTTYAERKEGRKCIMISQSVIPSVPPSVRLATFRFSIESQVISFLICDLQKVDVDLGWEQQAVFTGIFIVEHLVNE